MFTSGLFVTFSGLYTIVWLTPENPFSFPMGVLPCLIFQGETYDALSRILHNCIVHCPVGNMPIDVAGFDQAVKYVKACFLYDDNRPASQLGLGVFQELLKHVFQDGVDQYLAQAEEMGFSDNELYIPVSSCETVGDFLAICFNSYLADLEDGRLAFEGLAAMLSGTASARESENFNSFRELSLRCLPIEMKLKFDTSIEGFFPIYRVFSFRSYMELEYMRIVGQRVTYRRCANPECRKFFVAKRSSAHLCGFPAPQDKKGRPCREFYPQFANRLKTNQDSMLKKIRSTKCRLYNTSRRHRDKSLAVDALLKVIDENKATKMKEVIDGKLSAAGFSAWLDSLRVE